MRKGIASILALLLILCAGLALAEPEAAQPEDALTQAAEPTYDRLVVGSTTAMSGNFFTDMWGRNTADADMRTLLHGYNLIRWDGDLGVFSVDDSVVSGIVVTEDQDGNRTYTLALQDDLRYSDGTPITAQDYIFSLLFSVAPEVEKIGGKLVDADYISGMKEYRTGVAKTLSGVSLMGNRQLSITVKAEYLPFFYELALLSLTPYPIHVIAPGCEVADDGDGVYIRNADETVRRPIFTAELLRKTVLDPKTGYLYNPTVTSGPYKLVSYDKESHVAELEINEMYRGNSKDQRPTIQHLEFRLVRNEDMIAQLESGEIGLLNKCVNADAVDAGMQLVANDGAAVNNYARTGFSFISMNCERLALQSATVRRAIAHCFDKDSFITGYVRNYGMRTDGYYGIGQWMYRLVEGSIEPPVEAPEATATRAELDEYEETLAKWEALSLENMPVYSFDPEKAQQMLVDDGWTLNTAGGKFNPAKNDVRCKKIGGKLTALNLKLIYPEGNQVGEALKTALVEPLAKAGVKLTLEAKPFDELLRIYYRQDKRDCDMIYLATNFASVYDPSLTFNPADAEKGAYNTTALRDTKLYQLAINMRKTEPGDVLGYCQAWVAFEEAFAEQLPAIPVYTNVYFDFYTPTLHGYNAGASVSWAEAIVGAYLGPVETEETTEETEDGAIIFE